jgi:hypothetical protein
MCFKHWSEKYFTDDIILAKQNNKYSSYSALHGTPAILYQNEILELATTTLYTDLQT